MTDTESRYWNFLECYKGYLPAKEAAAAQQYVVLACKLNFTDTDKDISDNKNIKREKENKTNGFAAVAARESDQTKKTVKNDCDKSHTSNGCDDDAKEKNKMTYNSDNSHKHNKNDSEASHNYNVNVSTMTNSSSYDDRSFRDR